MDTATPSQKLLVRIPDVASLYEGVPTPQPSTTFANVPAAVVTWAPDGQLFAVATAQGVSIYDGETEKLVRKLAVPATAVAFSPQNTFLQTFERPNKDAGNAQKNLKLWDLATGEVVVQLFQQTMSKEKWPCLQLPPDESIVCHCVSNAVNIYDPRNFSAGVLRKLSLKGVGGVAVCPQPGSSLLAAYVPEAKGSPGFVGVFNYMTLTKGADAQPLARRSFFRASSVRLLWNSLGTAVLALTASDTDATNQSYYGEQKLHYLAADGTNDCLVPLTKEGPIHDVQWSPKGDYFCVVAGFMPAKTTLFSERCKPMYDLGSGPHSTVRWNPQGRFLAVAGFGNLPGDIVFFDKKADGKCKQMGSNRSENGVTCDWSPDGRYFMTATVAPRLRVDNGFKVFRYNGAEVHHQPVDVLLEACWRPAPQDAFPDRPQSPRAADKPAAVDFAATRSAGYVPPHLRNDPAAAAAAAQAVAFSLSQDKDGGAGGRLGVGGPKTRLPPGAAPPETKAASKNARRRSRKKGPGGDSAAGGEEDPAEAQSSQAEAVTPGMEDMAVSASSPAPPQPAGSVPSAATAAAGESPTDAAKRLRNLQKKLRQTQQLKEKAAAEGKKALTPEQQQKLGGEHALVEEIRSLGGSTE
ncbi:hypothetical protein WJX72_002838 [[Myrmecia] bisecta]|uniref:Eukaryotic translation initiation factor 2A n=1 Tax=[Myrmecia] bisecta TaxID=41462 RepID=A0AAW1R5K4_9CHLO